MTVATTAADGTRIVSLDEALRLAALVREGKSRSYVNAAVLLGAFIEAHVDHLRVCVDDRKP